MVIFVLCLEQYRIKSQPTHPHPPSAPSPTENRCGRRDHSLVFTHYRAKRLGCHLIVLNGYNFPLNWLSNVIASGAKQSRKLKHSGLLRMLAMTDKI